VVNRHAILDWQRYDFYRDGLAPFEQTGIEYFGLFEDGKVLPIFLKCNETANR
jgi:hypothetical protein